MLGEAFGAALRIPRSSVGPKAFFIGADRFARALAARWKRLTVWTEARWPRRLHPAGMAASEAVICARCFANHRRTLRISKAAVMATTTRAISVTATGAISVTAARAISVTAARTASTRSAASAWTAVGVRKGTRSRGQLPADTCTRHFAAPGTIISRVLGFSRRAELQAAEAARLAVATTITTTRTTTTTTATAISAFATATAPLAAAASPRIASTTRWTRDAIDHVVKLAT